jgi:tetratricopeptide (TPR) repeat protein
MRIDATSRAVFPQSHENDGNSRQNRALTREGSPYTLGFFKQAPELLWRTTLMGAIGLPRSTIAILLCFAGCAASGRTMTRLGSDLSLFDGMGRHHRTVTTQSRAAQRYFDQGLTWAYAFNHDEAIRSFEEAARLDPQCAMACWGVAFSNGPHINNPAMPPERSEAAWHALQKALALKENASPVERALIDALSRRYAWPAPEDRRALDEAYAAAMGEVWAAHGDDPDVGTLYAEALMDLHPWDLWTKDGRPKEDTELIVATLEEVLRIDSQNPGANHLYIHAIEASPNPERANAAADLMREAVPASGHLLHMPTHIDVLLGRWAQASLQNEKAIRADSAYRAIRPRIGFYRIYMAHNQHMLTFASMMEGRGARALEAARDVVAGVPEDYGREQAAFIDPWMSIPYDVLKRFGKWDELLAEPAPPSYWPISTSMWRGHRAIAFAAKGDVAGADRERAAFLHAVANVPADAVMGINKAHHVFDIAKHFVNGEIAFRKGNVDESVTELRRAAELEDELLYMEPPEWIQPVRHTLGAFLLSVGRYEEAEKIYREDLEKWPENGWSLHGLAKCLRARGATAEAQDTENRFRKAWARADTPIGSSCLCVPGT